MSQENRLISNEQQAQPFDLNEIVVTQEEAVAHLDMIPGVNRRIPEIVLAEVGHDMEQFKDGKHLASWLGLCSGNKASGGKRLSGKTRQGNAAVRQVLIEAGQFDKLIPLVQGAGGDRFNVNGIWHSDKYKLNLFSAVRDLCAIIYVKTKLYPI